MGDDDPIGRLRAQADQSKEGMREFAGTLWAFYSGLMAEGFDASQAFGLTATFLSDGLRGNRDAGDARAAAGSRR